MHLKELATAAQKQSLAGFVEANPHMFLLLKLSPAAFAEDDFSFRTRVYSLPQTQEVRLASPVDTYRVYPVAKAFSTPRGDIAIGRAENNDVVLPDMSVSKTHARFIVNADGNMFVVDAGSRNGTRVNDERLIPEQRMRVVAGDSLMFGGLVFSLMSPHQVYSLLQTMAR